MREKKILAVRNDRFGEFLLNIPAFRALKQNYTDAKLVLVVNPYVKELAKSIEFVDDTIVWENKKHRFAEVLKFSKELKNRRFDLCIIFNPSKEFNIISFLAGIPIRVGYARKWAFLLTHKMIDKKYLGNKHEIEYNLDLVNLIGVKTPDKTLSLNIEDDIITNLLKEFHIENCENLIVLHPWTSDPVKQWPLSNFQELTQKLIRELNIKLVLIGGKDELSKSKELFSYQRDNLINMTGKTTLRQLAAVLKRCKLLISCDSGPMHLASCVGTPVIAIFRNDIAGKSAKRWGPWGKGHSVIEKRKFCEITVDEVFDKVKEGLNK